MSQEKHWPNNGNFYSHGIVCQNCVVKKQFEIKSTVRTVLIGTLVEIYNIQKEDVLFCIVNNDLQVDYNLFTCKKGDVLFVPENLWGPLLTVEQKGRLPIVQDSRVAEALGNIEIGSTVRVMGPDFKNICIGNITFRNSIEKLGVGIYFGLKVTCSKDDLQTIIESCSLIQPGTKGFPRGSDIVVSIDKIYPVTVRHDSCSSLLKSQDCKSSNQREISTHKSCGRNLDFRSKVALHQQKSNDSISKFSYCENKLKGLNIRLNNENVMVHDIFLPVKKSVCLSDGKKGTIKWSELINKSLYAGKLKFDNPIHIDTGTVNSNKYSESKCVSAKCIHPESKVKVKDLEMSTLKEYIDHHKTTGNNNCKIRSNGQCCILKHDLDDKNRMVKSSFTNSKLMEAELHTGDSFEVDNCNDNCEGETGCNRKYKTEHSVISQLNCSIRSFEPVRSNDKKIYSNRWSKSMGNDCLETNELLFNLQNSFVSMQKFTSKSLDDNFHPDWTDHCELHNVVHGTDLYHPSSDSKKYWEHCEHLVTTEKKNIQVNDSEMCEIQTSEHSSSDESGDFGESLRPTLDVGFSEKLEKGSVVEVLYKGQSYYGVIRWKGVIRQDGDAQPPCLIAGVEMEKERDSFTDGTFRNKRYFYCNPKKALFVPLSECRRDSRFFDENKITNCMKNGSFGQLDCPAIEGTIPPINRRTDIEAICGKNKGIQGHNNSCYLDATLFAMFAFTSVFDSLLYRPPTVNDIPQYSEVQRVLKEEIVNPLRKNLYVRADRVMKLRTLLENLSSVSGLTCDEKDPEEFLNSLLAQILRAEPFLKLSSGQEAFHYQLFVEKDERLTFPSVQQLFEQSFVTSDIKLKQIPSCLIIQMPRFGKSFKMYSRIFPPQLLDVTDIIENSPRQCIVCGKLAEYECKDCFGQQGIGNGLESISFCKTCLETAHNHYCRMRHNYKTITVPFEFFDLQEHCSIPRILMELFAVVCIETSHYVAFVKCGSGFDAPWCFFDSMADRKGEQNGYNIPEMVACPNLPYWLSEEGAKTLNEMKDERQLPEHAKRLLCDAYMCMYQSPDIMMYR